MSFRSGVACLPLLIGALAAAGCTRESAPPVQANAADAAATVSPDEAPPRAGDAPVAGTVDRRQRGEPMPAALLTDLAGKPVTLAAGRPVLVNLWATWCAPCIAELPSLDAAAAGITAVALNQGEEPAKVRAFLAARDLKHLRPLLDPTMAVSIALTANLPTTILYDRAGKEVWRYTGDRDWTTPASRALIAEAG